MPPQIVVADNGRQQYAAGRTVATIANTTNHTVTEGQLSQAGGHLHLGSGGGPLVVWLPRASTAKGCQITMFKPAGDTTAYAFNATNGAKIEGSLADKKYENVTNEFASCTIWCNGVDWRVVCQKGTWVVNNT